jgi:hypothetical protein
MSTVPAIDYEIPNADTLPQSVPEADAILEAGGGPNETQHLFVKRHHAAGYFARWMSRRHTIETAGRVCCVCGAAADRAAVVGWTTRVIPHRFGFETRSTVVTYPFRTVHSLCTPCMMRWERRVKTARRWIRWTNRAGGFIGMLLIGCVALAFVRGLFLWAATAFWLLIIAVLFSGMLAAWLGSRVRGLTPPSIRAVVGRRGRHTGLIGQNTFDAIVAPPAIPPLAGVVLKTVD